MRLKESNIALLARLEVAKAQNSQIKQLKLIK